MVVFDRDVLVLALCFLLGDLHEESCTQCAADVLVVALVFEWCRDHVQFRALHDAEKLHADVVCGLKGSEGEEVVVTPLLGVLLGFGALKCVVDV